MAAHQRTTTILVFVDGDTEVARWRLEMRRADLSTVDALARLALSARRRGWTAQLRQPSAALGELLALVGLADLIAAGDSLAGQMGGQTEEAEQLETEEVVVPRDPPV